MVSSIFELDSFIVENRSLSRNLIKQNGKDAKMVHHEPSHLNLHSLHKHWHWSTGLKGLSLQSDHIDTFYSVHNIEIFFSVQWSEEEIKGVSESREKKSQEKSPRKYIINLSSAEFAQRVVKVKPESGKTQCVLTNFTTDHKKYLLFFQFCFMSC